MPAIDVESFISADLKQKLKGKRIDLVRFSRDLAIKSAQHANTPSGQQGEDFVLTQEIIDNLIAAQETMMKRGATTPYFIRNNRVRKANKQHETTRETAREIREAREAQQAAQKAREEQEALDKLHATLQEVFGQSTIGMTPEDLALKAISDIITRLEEQAKGKVYAQELIKSIALGFSKQEERLVAKEISISEYVANCKEILALHAPELTKPQTFTEAARDFFLNGLRTIFNVLDKLYAWAMSKEKTLAEETGRKAYIPEPKTVLAVELQTIQSEFPRLESELAKGLEAVAAKNEKNALRQQARIDYALKRNVQGGSLFDTQTERKVENIEVQTPTIGM